MSDGPLAARTCIRRVENAIAGALIPMQALQCTTDNVSVSDMRRHLSQKHRVVQLDAKLLLGHTLKLVLELVLPSLPLVLRHKPCASAAPHMDKVPVTHTA